MVARVVSRELLGGLYAVIAWFLGASGLSPGGS